MQSLAGTLVTSMVLTMPGMTAWADIPSSNQSPASTLSQTGPLYVTGQDRPSDYKSPLIESDGGGQPALLAAQGEAVAQLGVAERAVNARGRPRSQLSLVENAVGSVHSVVSNLSQWFGSSGANDMSTSPQTARALSQLAIDLGDGTSAPAVQFPGADRSNSPSGLWPAYPNQIASLNVPNGVVGRSPYGNRETANQILLDPDISRGMSLSQEPQYALNPDDKAQLLDEVNKIEKANLAGVFGQMSKGLVAGAKQLASTLDDFYVASLTQARLIQREIDATRENITLLQYGKEAAYPDAKADSSTPNYQTLPQFSWMGKPVENAVNPLMDLLGKFEAKLRTEMDKEERDSRCPPYATLGCDATAVSDDLKKIEQLKKQIASVKKVIGGTNSDGTYLQARDNVRAEGLAGVELYLQNKYLPKLTDELEKAKQDSALFSKHIQQVKEAVKIPDLFLSDERVKASVDYAYIMAISEQERSQEVAKKKAEDAQKQVIEDRNASLKVRSVGVAVSKIDAPEGWQDSSGGPEAAGMRAIADAVSGFFSPENKKFRAAQENSTKVANVPFTKSGAEKFNSVKTAYEKALEPLQAKVADGLQAIRNTITAKAIIGLKKGSDSALARQKDVKAVEAKVACIASGGCSLSDMGPAMAQLLARQIGAPGKVQNLDRAQWARAATAIAQSQMYNAYLPTYKAQINQYMKPFASAVENYNKIIQSSKEEQANILRGLDKKYFEAYLKAPNSEIRTVAQAVLEMRGIDYLDFRTGKPISSSTEWEYRQIMAEDAQRWGLPNSARMMTSGQYLGSLSDQLDTPTRLSNVVVDQLGGWGKGFSLGSYNTQEYLIGTGTGGSVGATPFGALLGHAIGLPMALRTAAQNGSFYEATGQGGWWDGFSSAAKSFGSGWVTGASLGSFVATPPLVPELGSLVLGVLRPVGSYLAAPLLATGSLIGETIATSFEGSLLARSALSIANATKAIVSAPVVKTALDGLTELKAFQWTSKTAGATGDLISTFANGGAQLTRAYLNGTVPVSLSLYGLATGADGSMSAQGLMGALTAPVGVAAGTASMLFSAPIGSLAALRYGKETGNEVSNSMRAAGYQGIIGNATAAAFGIRSDLITEYADPSAFKAQLSDPENSKSSTILKPGQGWSTAQKALDNWAFSTGSKAAEALAWTTKVATTYGDVMSFGVGTRVVTSAATNLLGGTKVLEAGAVVGIKNSLAEAVGMVAGGAPMVNFYKDQVNNFSEMLQTGNVGRYVYELSSFAAGVGATRIGAAESAGAGRSAEARGSVLATTLKESAKMAGFGILGQVLPVDVVAWGGAIGMPAYEAVHGAYKAELQVKGTAAIEKLQEEMSPQEKAKTIGDIANSMTISRRGTTSFLNGAAVPEVLEPVIREIQVVQNKGNSAPAGLVAESAPHLVAVEQDLKGGLDAALAKQQPRSDLIAGVEHDFGRGVPLTTVSESGTHDAPLALQSLNLSDLHTDGGVVTELGRLAAHTEAAAVAARANPGSSEAIDTYGAAIAKEQKAIEVLQERAAQLKGNAGLAHQARESLNAVLQLSDSRLPDLGAHQAAADAHMEVLALPAAADSVARQQAQVNLMDAQARVESTRTGPASSETLAASQASFEARAQLSQLKAKAQPAEAAMHQADAKYFSARAAIETAKASGQEAQVVSAQRAVDMALAHKDIATAESQLARLTKTPANAFGRQEAKTNLAVAKAELEAVRSGPESPAALTTAVGANRAQANLSRAKAARQPTEAAIHKADAAYFDAQAKLAEVQISGDLGRVLDAKWTVEEARLRADEARIGEVLKQTPISAEQRITLDPIHGPVHDLPSEGVPVSANPLGEERAGLDRPDTGGAEASQEGVRPTQPETETTPTDPVAKRLAEQAHELKLQELTARMHGDKETAALAAAERGRIEADLTIHKEEAKMRALGDLAKAAREESPLSFDSAKAKALHDLRVADLAKTRKLERDLLLAKQLGHKEEVSELTTLLEKHEAESKNWVARAEKRANEVLDRAAAEREVRAQRIERLARGEKDFTVKEKDNLVAEKLLSLQRKRAEAEKAGQAFTEHENIQSVRKRIDNALDESAAVRKHAAAEDRHYEELTRVLKESDQAKSRAQRNLLRSQAESLRRDILNLHLDEQSRQANRQLQRLTGTDKDAPSSKIKGLSVYDNVTEANARYQLALADYQRKILNASDRWSRVSAAKKGQAEINARSKALARAQTDLSAESAQKSREKLNNGLKDQSIKDAALRRAQSDFKEIFKIIKQKIESINKETAGEKDPSKLDKLAAERNAWTSYAESLAREDASGNLKAPEWINEAEVKKLAKKELENLQRQRQSAEAQSKIATNPDPETALFRLDQATELVNAAVRKSEQTTEGIRALRDMADGQHRYLVAKNAITKWLGERALQKAYDNYLKSFDPEVDEGIKLLSKTSQKALEKKVLSKAEAKDVVREFYEKVNDMYKKNGRAAIARGVKDSPYLKKDGTEKEFRFKGQKTDKDFEGTDQFDALVSLLSDRSINHATSGGKTLIGALFASARGGQVVFSAPTAELATQWLTKTVAGVKYSDIIEQVGGKTLHNVDQFYADYESMKDRKSLPNALVDGNGVLLVSREVYGFIFLKAQSDGVLRDAWNLLKGRVPISHLMDEVQNLATPMNFRMSKGSGETLGTTSPEWIKSQAMWHIFQKASNFDEVISGDSGDALKRFWELDGHGKKAYWYDHQTQTAYLTDAALEFVREQTGIKDLTTSNVVSFAKGWGQAEWGRVHGRVGAVVEESATGANDWKTMPVNDQSEIQESMTYDDTIYTAAFPLNKFGLNNNAGINARPNMVPTSVTDSQVAESQALARADIILGMTGTAEGARVLLQNKIGFGVDDISSAPDRILDPKLGLRMYKRNESFDATGVADRLEEFLKASAEYNLSSDRPGLRRGLVYGLTVDERQSLKKVLESRKISTDVVAAKDLKDKNRKNAVTGDDYYEGKGDPAKKPAQVVFLESDAGAEGSDWRGEYRLVGNLSALVRNAKGASKYVQLINRVGRTYDEDGTTKDFVAERELWVKESDLDGALSRLKESKAQRDVLIDSLWAQTYKFEQLDPADPESAKIKAKVKDLYDQFTKNRDTFNHDSSGPSSDQTNVSRSQAREELAKFVSGIAQIDGKLIDLRATLKQFIENPESLKPTDKRGSAAALSALALNYMEARISTTGHQAEARDANARTMNLEKLQARLQSAKGREERLQQAHKLTGDDEVKRALETATKWRESVEKAFQKSTTSESKDANHKPERQDTTVDSALRGSFEGDRAASLKVWQQLRREVPNDPTYDNVRAKIEETIGELSGADWDKVPTGAEDLTAVSVRTVEDAIAYAKKLAKEMLPFESAENPNVAKVLQSANQIMRDIQAPKPPTPSTLLRGEDGGSERGSGLSGQLIEHGGSRVPGGFSGRETGFGNGGEVGRQPSITVAAMESLPAPKAQVGLAVADSTNVQSTLTPGHVDLGIHPQHAPPTNMPAEMRTAIKPLTIPQILLLRAQAQEAAQQVGTNVPSLVGAIGGALNIGDTASFLYKQAGVRAPKSGNLALGSVDEWWKVTFGDSSSIGQQAWQRFKAVTKQVSDQGKKTIANSSSDAGTLKGVFVVGGSWIVGGIAAFVPQSTNTAKKAALLVSATGNTQGVNTIPLLESLSIQRPAAAESALSETAIAAAGKKAGKNKDHVVAELQRVRRIAHNLQTPKSGHGYTTSVRPDGTVDLWISEVTATANLAAIALKEKAHDTPKKLVIHISAKEDRHSRRRRVIKAMEDANVSVVEEEAPVFIRLRGDLRSALARSNAGPIADLDKALKTVEESEGAMSALQGAGSDQGQGDMMKVIQSMRQKQAAETVTLERLKLSVPQLSQGALTGLLDLPGDVKEFVNALAVAAAAEGTDALLKVLKSYLHPEENAIEPIRGITPDTVTAYIPAHLTPGRMAVQHVDAVLEHAFQDARTVKWAKGALRSWKHAIAGLNVDHMSAREILAIATHSMKPHGKPGTSPVWKAFLSATNLKQIHADFRHAIKTTVESDLNGETPASVALITTVEYPEAALTELHGVSAAHHGYTVLNEREFKGVLEEFKKKEAADESRTIGKMLPVLQTQVVKPTLSQTIYFALARVLNPAVAIFDFSRKTKSETGEASEGSSVTPLAISQPRTLTDHDFFWRAAWTVSATLIVAAAMHIFGLFGLGSTAVPVIDASTLGPIHHAGFGLVPLIMLIEKWWRVRRADSVNVGTSLRSKLLETLTNA